MWEWSDKLKLGKSAIFVKRDIRSLPQTEAEFEADFALDPGASRKGGGGWTGVVVERETGDLLALECVEFPPPTVNHLARLLAGAMLRPPEYEDRQRPRTIYLRDRPQWQELLPHLGQLGMEVVLTEDLPRFDEAAIKWIQFKRKNPPTAEEIRAALRKPFPPRTRTQYDDIMDLTEWTETMWKGAYPSRKAPEPLYDPESVVSIRLTDEELEAILTKTEIGKTKKLRPKIEAMFAAGTTIDLDIHEWGRIVLALCGPKGDDKVLRRHLFGVGTRIANEIAESLGIDGPPGLRT